MGRKAIRFGTRRKCRFSIGRRCTLPICYLLGISLDVLFIRFFLCFCGVFVIKSVWVDMGEYGMRLLRVCGPENMLDSVI